MTGQTCLQVRTLGGRVVDTADLGDDAVIILIAR